MQAPILTRNMDAPAIRKKEVLRYAGIKNETAELSALYDRAILEAENILTYKVCYREFNVTTEKEKIDLGFATVNSCDLAKNLLGCDKIVIFAATVGVALDRAIAKASVLSPSLALMLDALGTERIEALCDTFCESLREEYREIRPRFSAGYGDLPIELQRDIFASLECSKRIGLTLNDSLLMSPSKSVTAIVGIKEN